MRHWLAVSVMMPMVGQVCVADQSEATKPAAGVDPLAAAKAVVYQCGAGTDAGHALELNATGSASAESLLKISGSIDAGFFSFVRASIFRRLPASDAEKAYEKYVECVERLVKPEQRNFDPEAEKRQGQIAEAVAQLSVQTTDLATLVSSAQEKQANSDTLLLSRLDAVRGQLKALQTQAKTEPGVVKGELAVSALMGQARSLQAAGNYQSALDSFNQALTNPSAPALTPDMLSMKAQLLYSLRRFGEAAVVLQDGLGRSDPQRSPHAIIEDKRLLADCLTRVGKDDDLRQAVDLGIEVAQFDLHATVPNVAGALSATASAAQDSMQAAYHGDAIESLSATLDNVASAYFEPVRPLLYYSEAISKFELTRFIKSPDDGNLVATRARMAQWWSRLDRLAAGEGDRSVAARVEGQFYQWIVSLKPSATDANPDKVIAELQKAAKFYTDENTPSLIAEVQYDLAVIHHNLKNDAQCTSDLAKADRYAPAASAISADIAALGQDCADKKAGAFPNPGGSTPCQLAHRIGDAQDRKNRIKLYCPGGK